MALIYNKIVESNVEPSPNDLWLKDGKLKHYKGGWKDISGKSDIKIPTKVSELENDSEFVKSTSLGTAAFKDVEDLQGGDGKWNLLQTISLSGSAQSFPIISNMGEGLYTDGLLVVVNSSQDLTFNFGWGADQIKGKVIEVERLDDYPEYGSPATMIASYLIKGDNSEVIEVVHPGFGETTIDVSTSNGDELSGKIRLFYKKISNLKS